MTPLASYACVVSLGRCHRKFVFVRPRILHYTTFSAGSKHVQYYLIFAWKHAAKFKLLQDSNYHQLSTERKTYKMVMDHALEHLGNSCTRQTFLVNRTDQMLTNISKNPDTSKLSYERRNWKNWIGTCHPPCIKIEVDGEGLLVPFFTRHKASLETFHLGNSEICGLKQSTGTQNTRVHRNS